MIRQNFLALALSFIFATVFGAEKTPLSLKTIARSYPTTFVDWEALRRKTSYDAPDASIILEKQTKLTPLSFDTYSDSEDEKEKSNE